MPSRCVQFYYCDFPLTKIGAQKRLKGISTAHRPDEVSNWINRGRHLDKPPSVADLDVFGSRWKKWYTALMPDWRSNGDPNYWPLLSDLPSGEDWSGVKLVGERNGLCMLILSLSWWKNQSNEDPNAHNNYVEAAKDLACILPRIVHAGLPVAPQGETPPPRSCTPPPSNTSTRNKCKPDAVAGSPSSRRSRRRPRN